MAIIAGDSLPTSPSSGHLGQCNLCQKLDTESSSCGLVSLSWTDLQTELKIAGQSKVPEQLGHEKINGSQPRYLQFRCESDNYSISIVEITANDNLVPTKI